MRILQPLLAKYPLECIPFDEEIIMAHAVIFEPVGNNETPLKYTAGMILAVPFDCELYNVEDTSLIRIGKELKSYLFLMIQTVNIPMILFSYSNT